MPKTHPKRRKFRVQKAFRRYSRIEYQCSGTFTVLEDPDSALKRYSEGVEFLVDLIIAPMGYYERKDNEELFAGHELDALVKDDVLAELQVEQPVAVAAAA